MRLTIIPSRHTRKLENGMYETQMKDSIIINYTPTGEFDLINKGLVDHYIDRIDLNRLETIFSKDLFPNYNGHFDKINNEFYFNHTSKGVNNDAYMYIDKRGLITHSQRRMPANFINEFGFDKIVRSSFPNIVEGLGITNAVNLEGRGVVKGGVIYKEGGERADAPLTPNKTRTFLNSKNMYEIGDIVMVRSDVNMDNTSWLKLDGSQRNINDYKQLYNVLGPFYGVNESRGHYGQPWRQATNLFPSIGGDLSFNPKTYTMEKNSELFNLGGAALFSTKDKIFICGGYRGDRRKPLQTVYQINLNNNGEVSSVSRISDLPEPRVFSRALSFCGYIYLIGGSKDPINICNGEYILRSKIKDNGDLSPWEKLIKIPGEFSRCCVYISGNRLNIVGGVSHSGTYTENGVLMSTETLTNKRVWCFINPDGTLKTPWKEDFNDDYKTDDGGYYNLWSGPGYTTYKNDSIYTVALFGNKNNRTKLQRLSFLVNTWGKFSVSFVDIPYYTKTRYGLLGVTSNRNQLFSDGFSHIATLSYGYVTVDSWMNHKVKSPVTVNPTFRFFHEGTLTKKGVFFSAGIPLKNYLENREISPTSKPIEIKLNSGYQDFTKFMLRNNNPTTFNLPLVDDTVFYGNPYSYYIKAK